MDEAKVHDVDAERSVPPIIRTLNEALPEGHQKIPTPQELVDLITTASKHWTQQQADHTPPDFDLLVVAAVAEHAMTVLQFDLEQAPFAGPEREGLNAEAEGLWVYAYEFWQATLHTLAIEAGNPGRPSCVCRVYPHLHEEHVSDQGSTKD